MRDSIVFLMNESVPAGFTSIVSEAVGTPMDLNDLCIKHPAATFFVRVDGYSMINAGIHDGDMLVVDRSLEPSNNSIVIALYNGGFTVKRLLKNRGNISLFPENPKYSPVTIKQSDDFEVWGVVTFVIKKV
ncbi:MAG: SOS response UmuD protein, Serine peptidase, MEROPS family S24 [candidate division WS6 bacterium GW2011_GWF2_39_15]|uniref:SOS response UmuD protein, Serine peptidase, MEROPS family S24 n=1 Tax=candidate division WS6 bacterium GW2011_GWF2_39_15 TaxID=1619100 RepID=A0A0G0MPL4_9BACT|nr:MAG: SOS response UmuD protein, Serine peptidase, MEROPS family S24 [candidate division WS6 bacterium GW2011_GWF2_39_15]